MTTDFGLRFERLLGALVPGAIVVLGTWYFHRPFLLQRFPSVSAEAVGADTKAMVFIVLTIGAGVLIQHLADHAIVVTTKDASNTDKARRSTRHFSRLVGRVFSIVLADDPRVHAVKRYMKSPETRRQRFLKMVGDWAGATQEDLEEVSNKSEDRKKDSERVLVHQHVIARLKTLSDQSRAVVDEIYYEVHFAASLLTAFALLFPIAWLALWTSNIANDDFASFTNLTYMLLIGIVWLLGVVAAYSVKRQFRNFCSQVLTLGLHFHAVTGSPSQDRTSGGGHAISIDQLRGLELKHASQAAVPGDR